MPTLRLETLILPASDLGPENPLPDLRSGGVSNVHVRVGEDIPQRERAGLRTDDTRSCLPYRIRDGYDRGQAERPLRVAVLENEHVADAPVGLDVGDAADHVADVGAESLSWVA